MRVVRSGFRCTFLVAIWRGGTPTGITAQEVLEYHGIHTDHIAIRTSSYIGIDRQAKVVRVHALDYLVSRLSADDALLPVDDVFDSGHSLTAVIGELQRRCRRNMPDVFVLRPCITNRAVTTVRSNRTTTFAKPIDGWYFHTSCRA